LSDELWKMGAGELAAAIRARKVSSREVVEAHLARIDAQNPEVNAVVVRLDESALAAADAADRALAAGDDVGPLHGVPMTVKENIDLAGSATTHALVVLKDALPLADAPHAAQLRAVGAIPIGRTNLPDLGLRWHTDNALRGATLNPWAPDRTPGGSSGGDAAALATGMTPLGLGNDYAGSLRWPSQCCGTAALKPGTGRVPTASMMPEPLPPPLAVQLFNVQGPMGRHVRDLRLAFGSMCAPSPSDPNWVPAPLEQPPLAGLPRVSIVIEAAAERVDPHVAEGVRRAAEALADAGYVVEERTPPSLERAAELYFQTITGFGRITTRKVPIEQLVSKDFLRFQQAGAEAFGVACGEAAADVFAERHTVARAWSEYMSERPLVLAPVAAMQPFEVGYDMRGRDETLAWLRAIRMIVVASFLGLPSVAVPVGKAGGLPQGVQVIGARFREDLCLAAAEAIEDRLGSITPIDARIG
jgi:amidase